MSNSLRINSFHHQFLESAESAIQGPFLGCEEIRNEI